MMAVANTMASVIAAAQRTTLDQGRGAWGCVDGFLAELRRDISALYLSGGGSRQGFDDVDCLRHLEFD